jgi:hypothetical protein
MRSYLHISLRYVDMGVWHVLACKTQVVVRDFKPPSCLEVKWAAQTDLQERFCQNSANCRSGEVWEVIRLLSPSKVHRSLSRESGKLHSVSGMGH